MLKDMIRKYRKERGLYQSDLAEELNVSQATVASWENGTRRPDIEMIARIASFFNVSTDELLEISRNDDADRELWELREQVRRDPERHYLFSIAKDAKIEDVRQAVAIIDALKKSRGGD